MHLSLYLARLFHKLTFNWLEKLALFNIIFIMQTHVKKTCNLGLVEKLIFRVLIDIKIRDFYLNNNYYSCIKEL
jgi:hypothetical protein